MCDYSAKHVKQRAAVKDDVLVSHSISHHTRGFVGVTDPSTAVCLLPGTQLKFARPVRVEVDAIKTILGRNRLKHTMATFRQVNTEYANAYHDALEFPDGTTVMLTRLVAGQTATVIQLPVDPATLEGQARKQAEAEQRRAAYV